MTGSVWFEYQRNTNNYSSDINIESFFLQINNSFDFSTGDTIFIENNKRISWKKQFNM